jgi:hypothetical protein
MTSKGDGEFQELLRKYWWEYHQPIDPFLSAMGFLPALPRDEAAAALRQRARMLRTAADGMQATLGGDWIRESKPIHVAWMFERTILLLEAEIPWCERIAERIESGVSYLPETMPDWK